MTSRISATGLNSGGPSYHYMYREIWNFPLQCYQKQYDSPFTSVFMMDSVEWFGHELRDCGKIENR